MRPLSTRLMAVSSSRFRTGYLIGQNTISFLPDETPARCAPVFC
jgi:hypothetical protein